MGEPKKVAVLGVGRMGAPMAGHLVDAGHEVRVFDISAGAVAPLVERGAIAAASPAEAAQDADAVCVVVFDDAQAIEVISGPGGVLSTLASGSVVAVHTTVAIDTIKTLADLGAQQGVAIVDAGISGGEEGSQAGTLLTMVGGSEEAIERVRPFLMTFSKDVIHAGGVGAGMALKLSRNATGYVMMAAVHEAMTLAARAGVDLALLRRTIDETGLFAQALSPFALGGPGVLPDDAHESFRSLLEHVRSLGEKDLDQALDLALHIGADLPVTERARETFAAVMRLEN